MGIEVIFLTVMFFITFFLLIKYFLSFKVKKVKNLLDNITETNLITKRSLIGSPRKRKK